MFILPSADEHFEADAARPATSHGYSRVFWSKLVAAFAVCFGRAWVRFTWNGLSELNQSSLLLCLRARPASPPRLSTWGLVVHHIIRQKLVPVFAGLLVHPVFGAVEASGNRLEMRWTHTRSVFTDVVNVIAFWNRTNKPLIGNPMGWPCELVVNNECPISGWELTPNPLPASVLFVKLKLLCEAIKQWPSWSSCSHGLFWLVVNRRASLPNTM